MSKSRLFEGGVINNTRRPFIKRTEEVTRLANRILAGERKLDFIELANCERIMRNPAARSACSMEELQAMVRRVGNLVPQFGPNKGSEDEQARANILKAMIRRELHLRHAARLAKDAREGSLTEFRRANILVHARRGRLTLKDMKAAGISVREIREWGIVPILKQMEE